MATMPMLPLVWPREQAARQERTGTKALVGEWWRLCPNPMPDFQFGKGSFNGGWFSWQQLVQQGEKGVLHGAANAGEQMQTPLP